jgi:hypothetical protein
MKLLKLTYTLLKLILDASGTLWPDKWVAKFKKQIDSKCLVYFQKLHVADNDTFAIQVRPVLYSIAGLITIEAFIFNMIPLLSHSVIIKEMIFTGFFIFLTTTTGFLSIEELNIKLQVIYNEEKKAFKYLLYVVGGILVLAIALNLVLNPIYKGKELNEVLLFQVTWDIIKPIPIKLYLMIGSLFLLPFAFFLLQFGFARLVIRVFRKVIALTLEKSSKDPLKIITYIVAAILIVEGALAIFLK